ncbi:MAG: hypothetical protein M1314_02985 [Firmicutes bacterium]|nr:hypothetical protein [Bacillota bacterium]
MPRAIIDTDSSRPAYVRRTALRWAAVAVILVLAAFIGYQMWREVRASTHAPTRPATYQGK